MASWSLIGQIDQGLSRYYKNRGRKDYFQIKDDNPSGKFQNWCDDNGYDSDTVKDEFNGKVDDCEMMYDISIHYHHCTQC